MGWKKVGKAIGRGTVATLKFAGKTADKGKRLVEPAVDKYLFLAAANAGTVYGTAELIDRSNYSDPTNAAIVAGAAIALRELNYYGLFSPRTRKARASLWRLNRDIDRYRPASWIKTGLLAGTVAFLGSELNPYFQQVRQDLFPRVRDPSLVTDVRPVVPQVTRERPKAYETLGHAPPAAAVTYDFTGTKLARKNSMTGRIQRTMRWQPIYRAVETAHGLPKDTLAGMIMQESYGDPVQPNASNDGGLGLVHIQGTTARLYGLKIHGSSNRDSDRSHGRSLREMLRQCNYDAACAQEYDDRAHVIKVLDAGARIVREGKEKHGTWDAGVRYYRAPGKVDRNLTWRYLHDVKHWREGMQDPEELAKAARDFERRNGYSFENYTSRWHEMNRSNWELREYANGGLR